MQITGNTKLMINWSWLCTFRCFPFCDHASSGVQQAHTPDDFQTDCLHFVSCRVVVLGDSAEDPSVPAEGQGCQKVMEWAEAVRFCCSRASLHTGLGNGAHSIVTDSKLLPSVPLLSLHREH